MSELTPEQARAAMAAIDRAMAPFVASVRQLAVNLERWHRETFEPIARRWLHRRLVRALRAELERRVP